MQELGLNVDVALARPKKEIGPILKKTLEKGYDTVIVMGGDGTIETLFRALMSSRAGRASKMKIGILPSGTYNNIAKSIGIPEDLREACRLISDGSVRKMDLGQVTVAKKKPFYFFELTAIGLIAALYPDGVGIQQGRIGSIKGVGYQILEARRSPDGTSHTGWRKED